MNPVPLHVLVLTAFGPETAADGSGELGRWLDGYESFEREITVSGVPTPVRITDRGVGVTATGIGPTHAAATTTALLASEEIDTSEAYVLAAGVAGISPHAGTVGSVVLANYIVNWDAKKRYGDGTTVTDWGFGPPHAYELNHDLVSDAYDTVSGVELLDSAAAQDHRAQYDEPPAMGPPSVEIGSSAAGVDFWYGRTLAGEVERMVAARSGGEYATTECEGFGIAVACDRFDALDRYLSVRAGSNFDRPPVEADGTNEQSSEWRMNAPAFENAYRVGRAIADTIADERLSEVS